MLDEADHMADLGFLPAVKRLLDADARATVSACCSRRRSTTASTCSCKRYLADPVVHSVDPAVAPVSTMTHHVFAVAAADKPAVVRELAAGAGPRAAVHPHQARREEARQAAERGRHPGRRAARQPLPERPRAQPRSRSPTAPRRVLVATDIAARGIHVDDIALVVHVDPPAEHKAYLHRSGRTARAGAEGVVVTLMTPEQVGDVRTLAKAARIEPTITRVVPGHAMLQRLVGPPAPKQAVVVFTPAPAREPSRPKHRGARSDQRRHSGRR